MVSWGTPTSGESALALAPVAPRGLLWPRSRRAAGAVVVPGVVVGLWGALWLLPPSSFPVVPLSLRCRPGPGGRSLAPLCGPAVSAGGCAGRRARSRASSWSPASRPRLPLRPSPLPGVAGAGSRSVSGRSPAPFGGCRCRSRRCVVGWAFRLGCRSGCSSLRADGAAGSGGLFLGLPGPFFLCQRQSTSVTVDRYLEVL